MQRLYLHVGLPKSGTTYLQQTWRANADELARQGVWTPSAPGDPVVRLAVWDLVGRRPRGTPDPRIAGRWRALTDAVAARAGTQVLLSEEYLAARARRHAERAVAGFGHHEVHVVVTARDLGRVLVSAWQEDVKSGGTATWQEFVDAVRDPRRRTRDPARGFWLRQDLAEVLRVWVSVVGPARVHVVTVPGTASPRGLLLERLGGLVGYDAASLTRPARRTNDALTAADVEVVRRLDEQLAGALDQRRYDWVVKHTLETRLAPARAADRMVLPAEHLTWARKEAERMAGAVEHSGVQVVGDLAELLPVPPSGGRAPGVVSDAEVAEAAIRALEALAVRGAGRRAGRRAEPASLVGPPVAIAASGARGVGFRLRRRGADLADHNTVAAAAMGVYLQGLHRRGVRGGAGGGDVPGIPSPRSEERPPEPPAT